MADDSLRTDSGIYLPPGAETNAAVLEKRMSDAIKEEVAQMAEWARSWERGGQKPLQKIDIQQACMAKAQVYSWPPRFMIVICAGVCDELGLNVEAPPETRQQRRDRERRGRHLQVARPAIDPQDPSGTSS